MKIPFRARALAALAACAALVLVPATTAFAHVAKSFGRVHVEMGFGDEPTYTGQPNSVFLGIERNGTPVTDLTDTLKVTVSYGQEHIDLPVVPNFEVGGDGTPGDYRAWFVPSQPGKYTFHFLGSIGSQQIDQSFTSGPTTFDEATDPRAVEFPAKLPTLTEVSQLLGRLGPRVDRATTQVASLGPTVESARSAGDSGFR